MTRKSKYDMPAVQNFAFGGIANPSQRAFLRGSDQSYLDARQKELDAFEAQRLAYNDQLTKWQNEVYNPYKAQVDAYNTASEKYNTEVYNPYKAQVDAYNAAAEKYNTEVYNPYKSQFDKYKEAVDAYNAGDRLTDYAGPAEPTLASQFTMTAPTQPGAFGMAAPTTPEQFAGVAPVLPFKEEEVVARQKEAASRARSDAANRAVAVDVVSNPDQFNFGSMSVSNRFMAKGGEVMKDQETARSIIKDFENYGYTKDEIMALADQVAAAGRGGDELLAYLSPESVKLLKSQGGAGTINPITGLPEFKGGFIGRIVESVVEAFNPKLKTAPAGPLATQLIEAEAPPPPPAPTPAAPAGPTSAELMKQLEDSNNARTALQTKYDTDLSTFKTQAQKDQEAAVANALKLDADKRAAMIAKPVIGEAERQTVATPPAATPPAATPPAATPPAATSTFVPGPFQHMEPPAPRTQTVATPPAATSTSPYGPLPGLDVLKPPPVTPTPVKLTPKDRVSTADFIGNTIGPRSVSGGPASTVGISAPNVSFTPVGAATPMAKLDLRGRITSPTSGRTGLSGGGTRTTAQGPDNSSGGEIPIYRTATPDYSSRGVGAVGAVGNIPIYNPAVLSGPMFGSAATNPSSYFAMTPQSSTGLAPGSMAIGSPDMPLAAGRNTLNAIAANPNLSPTMLGGQQNAGYMTDRLGNRIYAPGMRPLYGFARGGGVDVGALLAQNTETLSDEKPEEVINTDPVGTAQKYLADLSGAGRPSPTRQAVKRVKTSAGGGATADKGMQMAYEALAKGDLSEMKDRAPTAMNSESARSQMEELARVYQIKLRAAQNAARGLAANTFGAPTLEGPTLTKGRLTKKRFAEGGPVEGELSQ